MKFSLNRVLSLGLISAVMSSQAMAATLTISGSIPAKTQVTVTPVAGYNTLDLTTDTSSSGVAVATLDHINNTANGYTLTITGNGVLAPLTTAWTGQTAISYTAKYDGSSVDLTGVTPVIDQGAQTAVAKATGKQLKIYYAAASSDTHMNDSYRDTLTFTIGPCPKVS